LIIEDGGYLFAVPQSSVEEVLRITGEELMRKINKINNTMVLKHRKGLLPLIDFSDFLGLSSSGQDDIHRILILKTGRQKFGIMIDNILDNEEIVVKPLSKYLRSSPCYSGASILGNGKIAPILDPVGIVQMSKLEKLEAFNETETETRNKFIREDARETMLIFESGGKELFALPFFQIARIVKITPEKIEKLKDTHYLKHGDETMLLIDSGMFTGMNRTWMAGSGEPVLAVVPRGEGSRIALAVSRIFNTTFSGDELDTGEQPEKFILGKIISENRIATVLDLDEIIRSVLDEEDAFHLSSGEIRKRFLLIDTSPFLGTAQKIQLEKAGFTVITARDVDEGWQLIRKKLFDAILIDADISDSEVCAITDRMKREKDLMEIPVIILQSTIQTPTTRDCFSEKSLETAVKLNMKEITAVLRKYETAAAGSV
jgi:two-component system chemotaxis sensor kinase CheA